MKLSKRLIAAIGMLSLSAVMLVTSSFAWFSMNTNVSANGMTVTAQGEQVYLQIIKKETGSFAENTAQTSVDFSAVDAVALKPVSVYADNTYANPYAGGNSFVWASASSESDTDHTADDDTYETRANVVQDGYALMQSLYIRLDPAAGTTTATAPLKASSVTLAENTTALAKTVSVLVVCGSKSQLFRQEEEGGKFVFKPTGDGKLTEAAFTNPGAGYVQVDVYVFFDGENENCTTANYRAAKQELKNQYAVSVNFTCA